MTERSRVVAKTVRRHTNKLVDAMLEEIAPDKRNDPRTQASAYLALARIMVARADMTFTSPRLRILLKAFNSDLLSQEAAEPPPPTKGPRRTASGIVLPT